MTEDKQVLLFQRLDGATPTLTLTKLHCPAQTSPSSPLKKLINLDKKISVIAQYTKFSTKFPT